MTPSSAVEWSQPTEYERWYQSPLGRAYGESVERVVRPWMVFTPTDRALDVGCGPGLALERLFPAPQDVWGVDCSHETARRAWARSQELGLNRHIVVATVERLPFADATFDLVSCLNCLEFVAQRDLAFAELARVLRPGGRAIVGVLNRRSVWELTRRLWRHFSRRPYYHGRFFTPDELARECAAAGLTVQEILTAVHFPPIPPGPLARWIMAQDRRCQARGTARGGVLLCRAERPLR
jgi:SAM-dependent methyltransferase